MITLEGYGQTSVSGGTSFSGGVTVAGARFTHVQGNSSITAGSQTTISVVLTPAPVTGHVVCVALLLSGGTPITGLTIKDANNNSYTVTPNSPSSGGPAPFPVFLAYLLSAPSNASATITAAWTSPAQGAELFADEFAVLGAAATFDVDIAGNGLTGTTINSPTITPAHSKELLYAAAGGTGTMTAPTANATIGVWTGAGGGIQDAAAMAEYILNGSTATAVNFTQTSGDWDALAMAIQ